MSEDKKDEASPGGALAELLAKNFNGLILVSILQSRSMLVLAQALHNDPGVSKETKLAAEEIVKLAGRALEEIENITDGAISRLELQGGN